MERNDVLLDANAIIRLFINDINEQHITIKQTIKEHKCFTILPVI